MKRIFDIIISITVFILFFPLLVVVFFLVKSDGGPAFFFQKRVGLYGEAIFVYKFRSMVVNSSVLGGYSTEKNDPRITPVGKIIRKTSIDELPQVINVLKGDMSLVGPRPNVYEQASKYSQSDWIKRNSVLPGITGLAQCTLRSNATFMQKLELDLTYVDKVGLLLDLKIIIMTIKQVFFKGGN